MSPLLPKNPVGDVLKRVDHTLESADASLVRVDETLGGVDGTLTTVSGTLAEANASLEQVGGTLAEATGVLSAVQELLTSLEDKLELIDQVPVVLTRLEEIQAAIATRELTMRRSLAVVAGVVAALAAGAPRQRARPRRCASSRLNASDGVELHATVAGQAPLSAAAAGGRVQPLRPGPGSAPAAGPRVQLRLRARARHRPQRRRLGHHGCARAAGHRREPRPALLAAVQLGPDRPVRLLGQRHRRLPRHAPRLAAVRARGVDAGRHQRAVPRPDLHRRDAQPGTGRGRDRRHRRLLPGQPSRPRG